MRNVTATVTRSQPSKKRQQRNAKVDVNVTVERQRDRKGKGGGKRQDKRGSKTALAYPKSGSMVPKPSDSKAMVGESNATRSVKGDIEQIATQMIAPHFTGVVKRSPCVVNFKNHLTKFNNALSFDIPASGQLVGRFTPTPAFMEFANDAVKPAPGAGGFLMRVVSEPVDANKGFAEVAIGGLYAGTVRSIQHLGAWAFPINAPTGTTIQATQGSAPDSFDYWDSTGVFHTDNFNIAAVCTLSADCLYGYFKYSNGVLGVTHATFDFDNGGFGAGTLFSAVGVELPESTQTLRTTLLTGLVTFTGSSLQNNGTIVMALVDPNWYPSDGDIFDVLSKLPDRRYVGPLKTGSYGWWMPARLEEETPQDAEYFDRNPRTSALWFAISGASPGQSVKVEGNIGMEFYSPEQVYAHVPCIAKAPVYQHLFDLFNHLPHVMPNDSHDDMCKGMLSKVKGSINNAIKNPATLCLGIAALA